MRQTCDPLTARWWFKYTEEIMYASTAVVFIILFFFLLQWCDGFPAVAIALAGASCPFFYFLNRVIGIKCPNPICGKYIETNTAWICGNKDMHCRNDHVHEFPFINQCEHCGFIPKTYQCHHCNALIFLSIDKQETVYARCADIFIESKPVEKKKDDHVDAVTTEIKNIEIAKLKVQKAELDVALKGLNSNLEPVKIPTVTDRYKNFVKNEEEYRQLKAEIDEKYKNDDDARERHHRIPDQEFRRVGLK